MFFYPHTFLGIVHPMACGPPKTKRSARPKQPLSRSAGGERELEHPETALARDGKPAGPLGSRDCARHPFAIPALAHTCR